MPNELSDEMRDYLGECIEEALDRAADHLEWLDGPDGRAEDNREIQIADTHRAIEIGRQAQALFPA